MKAKTTEQHKSEVPFDPVLFAATVPSRKPTARDRADCTERFSSQGSSDEFGGKRFIPPPLSSEKKSQPVKPTNVFDVFDQLNR